MPSQRRYCFEKVCCVSAHYRTTADHARERRHAGDCCVLDEPCYCGGDLCAAGRHCRALAAFALCRRQLEVSNSIPATKIEETIYEENPCPYAVTCHVLHRMFDRLGIDTRFHPGCGSAGTH